MATIRIDDHYELTDEHHPHFGHPVLLNKQTDEVHGPGEYVVGIGIPRDELHKRFQTATSRDALDPDQLRLLDTFLMQ